MIGVTQDKEDRVRGREEDGLVDPRAGDLRWIGWRRSEKKGASESVCTTRDQKLKGNERLWCEPFYSGQLTAACACASATATSGGKGNYGAHREPSRASTGATLMLTCHLTSTLCPPTSLLRCTVDWSSGKIRPNGDVIWPPIYTQPSTS